MQRIPSPLGGIWLPIITPFRHGRLDEPSFRRLVRHYAGRSIDGFILGATTGEGLTLDNEELARLAAMAGDELDDAGRHVPVFLGMCGSHTRKLMRELEATSSWPIDGYLISCPYYTRPSQQGLYQHFAALADSAPRQILIYNIPYRTGVNMSNETMLALAEHRNIVGTKDCCADPIQSFDLLRRRAATFAVLTGEDAHFLEATAHGADGGILASAHVDPDAFARVRNLFLDGRQVDALTAWRTLFDVTRLLFSEPSPAPIKHWLFRVGLIESPEVRLPMTGISPDLAQRIDDEIGRRAGSDEEIAGSRLSAS